jgi:VCBS repeat protein
VKLRLGSLVCGGLVVVCMAGAQTPTPPPPQATVLPPGPSATEGPFLTDDQGRRYVVEKLSKLDGQYTWTGTNQIRTSIGMVLDVLRQDEQFVYVKVYRYEPQGTTLLREPPPPLGAAVTPQAEPTVAPTPTPLPQSGRLRFESFGDGLPTAGQWRNGFDLGDMNGDRHLDIVHGPARKSGGVPVIFLGDGRGHWQRWKEAAFPPEPYDYGDAAAADFNGDKTIDLALAIHLHGLLVLVNDGHGRFSPWTEGIGLQRGASDPPAFSSRALRAVDWNGDGKPDLVALGEGPRLAGPPQAGAELAAAASFGPAVLLNNGDGTWTWKRPDAPMQLFGDSIAVGDFDGDRRPDVATGSSWLSRRDLIVLSKPDGGFAQVTLDPLPSRAYCWAVAAADWDKDGRDDLAVGYTAIEGSTWWSGVDVLLSQPDGRWRGVRVAREPDRRGVFALGAGDIDGDGAQDLVALTGEGQVWVFLGDGKGSFTRETASELAEAGQGCRGYHVQLADLDGDGKAEIVAGFAGEPSGTSPTPECPSGGSLQAWKAFPR